MADGNVVRGWKAHPTLQSDPEVPDLMLLFDEAVPSHELEDGQPLPDWERIVTEQYRSKAEEIADALHAHLPGGLLDALLAELLERRVSLLRVRFTDAET